MTTAATSPRSSTHAARPAGPAPNPPAAQGVAPVDPIKLLKQHAALLVICTIVGAVIGGAAHFGIMASWPVYKAHVLYQCTPPITDLTKADNVYNQDEFDRFMGTQAALMTSELVLQQAVKDPEVRDTKWAKRFVRQSGFQPQAAAIALEDRLSARIRPMTNLVQLTCTWRDPVDCATIVNAVNRAYLEDSRKQAVSVSADQRNVLSRRLEELTRNRTALTTKRDLLIAETGLTSDNNGTSAELFNIQALQQDRSTTMGKVSALESMVKDSEAQISDKGTVQYPDRVREAALADQSVRQMDSELSDLQSREQALNMQNFGENHPDVRALRTLIESKRTEREKKFEEALYKLFMGDLDNTRTSLAAARAQITQLDAKIAEATKRLEATTTALSRLEQIKAELKQLLEDQAETEKALKKIDGLGTLTEASRVRVIRTGQTPTTVSFPRIFILVPAGAVLLPLLVGGALFLRELFDQRVRGPADLALLPRTRVLGVIPDAAEDPARPAVVATAFRDSPSSAITESIRQIRAPLAKKLEQSGHKSLLVIPGMPGSGGTSVVTNLAIGNAAAERRVLIIDANFRRPGVHKVFGLGEGPGLGDVLSGASDLAGAIQSTTVPNLSVLAAGTAANRALPERLSTDTMTRLIREVSEQYDLVLIDAPPAIVSGDGVSLANRCDAVALVVRALAEKRGLVARLQHQLSDSRAEFLGIILNAARASAGGYFKRNIKATHEYQNNHKA